MDFASHLTLWPSFDRVTVTLPSELIGEIDLREKNRSRFIAVAIRNELDRRRRYELHRSLQNPHPESSELAEQGLDEWTRSLPEEDTAALVDRNSGGRGAIVVVELDSTIGQEQRGVRPCVIVSHADVTGSALSIGLRGACYGYFGGGTFVSTACAGQEQPAKRSFSLIDHLRSIDKRRVRSAFGEVAQGEMAAIDEGLAVFLGLGDPLSRASAPPV